MTRKLGQWAGHVRRTLPLKCTLQASPLQNTSCCAWCVQAIWILWRFPTAYAMVGTINCPR